MTGAVRCLCRALTYVGHRTPAKCQPRCRQRQLAVNPFRSFSSASRRLAEDSNSGTDPATTTEQETGSRAGNEVVTVEDFDPETRAQFDRSSPEDQDEMRQALRYLSKNDGKIDTLLPPLDNMDQEIAREVVELGRTEPPVTFQLQKPNKNRAGFWADDEDDEFGRFADDEEFRADDIATPAHAQLDLHRDMREYQRRIAWDMPLLRKFAKTFHPPPLTSPLRFRYTTYMGEEHPAAKKVVVEFCTSDLPSLTTPQHRNKLIKLAGVRYNPSTDVVKMSCEKFETPAQNKRYLGDLVNKLIAEATDPAKDSFEDVPFDFRHHRPKKVAEFPDAWKLGRPEKVRELVEARQRRRLLGEGKSVVDGDGIVREYVHAVTAFQASMPETSPMLLGRAQGRGRGARGLVR